MGLLKGRIFVLIRYQSGCVGLPTLIGEYCFCIVLKYELPWKQRFAHKIDFMKPSILTFRFLIFLFCLAGNVTHGQTSGEIYPIDDSCERGMAEARNDYTSNQLGLYFYGSPSPRYNNYIRLICKEYDLVVKGGGSFIDQTGVCYNRYMKEKILERYGANAFDRIQVKLDSLYEVGLGDRNAEFPGGEHVLVKYLYCNLDADLFQEEQIPILAFRLTLNAEGYLSALSFVYSNTFAQADTRYEDQVRKLINAMPPWIPAIENQTPIPFEAALSIKFSRSTRNKFCSF
jgi:hypothetical protein